MDKALLLTTLLIELLGRAAAASELLRKAQAEGRDVTQEELDELVSADDAKRVELAAAIAAARTP